MAHGSAPQKGQQGGGAVRSNQSRQGNQTSQCAQWPQISIPPFLSPVISRSSEGATHRKEDDQTVIYPIREGA